MARRLAEQPPLQQAARAAKQVPKKKLRAKSPVAVKTPEDDFVTRAAESVRAGIFAVVYTRLGVNIDTSNDELFGLLVTWRENDVPSRTERQRQMRDELMSLPFLRRAADEMAQKIRVAGAMVGSLVVENKKETDDAVIAEAMMQALAKAGLPVNNSSDEEEQRLYQSCAYHIGAEFARRCSRSGLAPDNWFEAVVRQYGAEDLRAPSRTTWRTLTSGFVTAAGAEPVRDYLLT